MRAAWTETDLLMVDHYQRGASFERAAQPWACHVAALDDEPEREHAVDLLIDQTAGRKTAEYRGRVPAEATILTGSEYVLLRREITEQTPASRPVGARRVLVTFGGADGGDLSARAVEALADPRFAAIAADVVVGPGYANPDRLAGRAAANTRILIDPPDLPGLMAAADVAVAGSGTTAWELAYLGVPSLLIVNSRGAVVDGMVKAGAALRLGRAEDIDPPTIASVLAALIDDADRRTAMSAAGRRLIDGRGAERVADAIEQLVD